ncbi:hypothetical protein E3P86_00693 [Wallemia ichthyophaga]|uniref:Histone-lysine N-methyltransferase, H3 lysine-4 specific n=1 Tax=Wallemia ichthyophaga TaxID=245174 RepID=A0A4T0JD16_WALIC|nr:hypothetical protein E3P86_00693 [Wallemia ichthyophaga]
MVDEMDDRYSAVGGSANDLHSHNDRSSLFDNYARKHGTSSNNSNGNGNRTHGNHGNHGSYTNTYKPTRNDNSSVMRVYEHRPSLNHTHTQSHPVSISDDDKYSDSLGRNSPKKRVSRGAERVFADNGVVPVKYDDSSPTATRTQSQHPDLNYKDSRLAAQARSALEKQKTGNSKWSTSTEGSYSRFDSDRQPTRYDSRTFSPSTSYAAAHRDRGRDFRTSFESDRDYDREYEREYQREYEPVYKRDYHYQHHYPHEYDHHYDYDGHLQQLDCRRRPPPGYTGGYRGNSYNPHITAQRPPQKKRHTPPRTSRRPSPRTYRDRDYDFDYTQPSSQYPPANIAKHELPAKPVSIYSPMPQSSIPPHKRQYSLEREESPSKSFQLVDPTRPPIKPEGKQNYLIKDGKKRFDGDGLLTQPSDPRKNRHLFVERINHEKNRNRYSNNLIFLKSFIHDEHSLQPPPTSCICIKGIPSALTENDLNTYFKGKYKTFKSMKLHYDRSTGAFLGLVWISFRKYTDAEACIDEFHGAKNFNLGKAHIGSVPPIQVRPDEDGNVYHKVVDDFYKKREENESRARREREEKRRKEASRKAAESQASQVNQAPKVLPTPSTKIGFNPNQQTPTRPGAGQSVLGKTSWLSSASKPSNLAHTPSHPKPLEMAKAGSEDTEDEDEWDDLHGDEIFRGRSDNVLTRKKESPVKNSQHHPDAIQQDAHQAEISIEEKIKKNGNAHIFIDKSSLPVHSVDVVDVRAFFGQFKVSDVLKNDDGWFVLFTKPGIAGRAMTTSDGKQCSGFTMHLQLRDPRAQQLETLNDINKDKVKLSDKRTFSEEPHDSHDMDDMDVVLKLNRPLQSQKSKRGRVMKSKNKHMVDFTSSEGESGDEKQSTVVEKEPAFERFEFAEGADGIRKNVADVAYDGRDDRAHVNGHAKRDFDTVNQHNKVEIAAKDNQNDASTFVDNLNNAEAGFIGNQSIYEIKTTNKPADMIKTESEQTTSTDNAPDNKFRSKKASKAKKVPVSKRKTSKATKKSSKNALKTPPPAASSAKSEESAQSDISEEADDPHHLYTPKNTIPTPPLNVPPFDPISDPSRPYTKTDILSSDLVNSEEDLYYLKTVIDREARKLPTTIQELLQCHNYTPPDWKDDLRFSIFNSPEKTDENAPWRPPVHATGSARSEGIYPIPETEKAFYLPQRNKVTKASRQHGDRDNVSSRANRSNARSLVHGLTGGATDGEILKFNQLRTRKKELKFAKSSIHSWGLYSCQVIPKGEMVIEYVGEVVRQQVADRREKAYEKQGIGSSYLFKIDDDNIVDATMKGSVARLINHCCQPNCTAKIITILGEKKIIIYAKEEISPGDEITYDYHFPIEDEKIPCLCGALEERFGSNHTSIVTQPTHELEKPDPFSPPAFGRSQTQLSPQKVERRTSLTPQLQNLGKSNYISPNRGERSGSSSPVAEDHSLNEFEKAIGNRSNLRRHSSLSRDASSAGLKDNGPAHKKASPSPLPAQLGGPPPFQLKGPVNPPLPRNNSNSAPPFTNHKSNNIRHTELHNLVDVINQRPDAVKEEILIVDIRSYTAFSTSRIPGAVSICLPSTLLRRPIFSLDKIIQMVPDPHDRSKLEAYRKAKTIIVYDTDTNYVGEGMQGTPAALLGVFRKFENAGAIASLEYISGGFAAYTQVKDAPVETTPKSNGFAEGQNTDAFQGVSTTTNKASPRNPHSSHSGDKFAANPFFDSVRQNRELANGMSHERISMSISDETRRNSYKLPPFLRRIVDMSEKQANDELAYQFYRLERTEQKRMMEVFDWLSNNSQTLDGNGNHSKSLGSKERDDTFHLGKARKIDRYSIGAGVELGHKNRYRNIYPFEHTRVKLRDPEDSDGNDYVNANHVLPGFGFDKNDGFAPSPLYTGPAPPHAAGESDKTPIIREARKDLMHHTKRYIATQGPMESTLKDFWQVCWEQDVALIVMLTKQREGGLDKCCRYWANRVLDEIEIQVLTTEGDEGNESGEKNTSSKQSFIGRQSSTEDANKEKYETTYVKRTIMLKNRELRQEKIITQYQYLGWPDFDTPTLPDALLPMIADVNGLYDSHRGPIVVHCSAGVGRTGSYVALDTMLDLLRDERKSKLRRRGSKSQKISSDDMQVDMLRPGLKKVAGDRRTTSKDGTDMDQHNDVNMQVERQTSSSNIDQKVDFPFGPPSPPTKLRGKLSSMSSQASGVSETGDVGDSLKAANLDGEKPEHQHCGVIKGLHEPVCDVVEDLREQRMSMVSTLRQYVYVYSALVAGVLNEIKDENC